MGTRVRRRARGRSAILATLLLGVGALVAWQRMGGLGLLAPTQKPVVAKPITRSKKASSLERKPPLAAKPAEKKADAPQQEDPRKHGFSGEIFARLDHDGDFLLSAEELPAAHKDALLAFDADKSKTIDFSEFRAAIEKLSPRTKEHTDDAPALLSAPPEGKRVPVYTPGGAPGGATAAPGKDWFQERDKDGDGQLGLYEWPPTQLSDFQRVDRNRDGFVTREEYSRMPAANSGAKAGSRRGR